jgi:glycine cleavage system H protein
MSKIPDNLRYRDSHEWIDPMQDPAPVGITDHAQAGAVVTAGQQVCVIESVKAASDIYAPLSGEIVAVNEALQNEPGLINTDPYLGGHIFKIKPSNPAEVEKLMTPAAYAAHIG